MELHVTPKDFSQLRGWSVLPECEFLGKVYARYPWLRDKPFGETVRVIVDWVNTPNCHRCGRPCVQGNKGSWMCDCTSTPFDCRKKDLNSKFANPEWIAAHDDREICPKCKEPINDDMGHMCP